MNEKFMHLNKVGDYINYLFQIINSSQSLSLSSFLLSSPSTTLRCLYLSLSAFILSNFCFNTSLALASSSNFAFFIASSFSFSFYYLSSLSLDLDLFNGFSDFDLESLFYI